MKLGDKVIFKDGDNEGVGTLSYIFTNIKGEPEAVILEKLSTGEKRKILEFSKIRLSKQFDEYVKNTENGTLDDNPIQDIIVFSSLNKIDNIPDIHNLVVWGVKQGKLPEEILPITRQIKKIYEYLRKRENEK